MYFKLICEQKFNELSRYLIAVSCTLILLIFQRITLLMHTSNKSFIMIIFLLLNSVEMIENATISLIYSKTQMSLRN